MPILPLISAGAGLVQSILGGINARKATKKLEGLDSPKYSQNQSILDYYNQALGRYNVSPNESAMYKRQTRDIDRGVAGAVSGLNDRRSGIAGISSILRNANDARLDANVAAENEKSRRFGELGNATQAKAGEDRMAFQQNEVAPFERKYNLLAMKAGAANNLANTGLSNIFSGIQNGINMSMYNKEFGENGAGKSSKSTPSTNSGNGLQGVTTDWLMKNRKRKSIIGR